MDRYDFEDYVYCKAYYNFNLLLVLKTWVHFFQYMAIIPVPRRSRCSGEVKMLYFFCTESRFDFRCQEGYLNKVAVLQTVTLCTWAGMVVVFCSRG